MKKIILVLLAVLLMCASAGCIAEEETEEVVSDKYIRNYEDGPYYVSVYVDKYTGVEYLIYDCYQSGGMCPRYNADGTLKINEEFKNDY